MDKAILKQKIEAKRRELEKTIEKRGLDVTCREILKLSKELDKLIALYNKSEK